MSDPVFVAFNVALGIAFAPTGAATEKHGDPGPSPECPADMRLVTGTHFENVQHYCTDPRKAKDPSSPFSNIVRCEP